MKSNGKIIGGVILLLLGIGLMLEVTHVIDFNFEGWWTAFIIIPCLISFFNTNNKTLSLIGVGAGVLLLLATRGVIPWEEWWRYMICIVFIIWGIMLIFSRESSMGCASANKKNVDDVGDPHGCQQIERTLKCDLNCFHKASSFVKFTQ